MSVTAGKKSPARGRKPSAADAEAGPELSAGLQERNVGYNLIRTYDLYVRYLKTRTRSRLMNLSLTQWRTLTFIRFNPGQRQRALSTAVGIDPSTMSPIIDSLERKGWVRREGDRQNRSAYEIHLTESGAEAYKEIEAEMTSFEKMLTRSSSDQVRRALADSLKTLHDTMAHELDSGH